MYVCVSVCVRERERGCTYVEACIYVLCVQTRMYMRDPHISKWANTPTHIQVGEDELVVRQLENLQRSILKCGLRQRDEAHGADGGIVQIYCLEGHVRFEGLREETSAEAAQATVPQLQALQATGRWLRHGPG